jgi:curli production assembly/transport component CsgE
MSVQLNQLGRFSLLCTAFHVVFTVSVYAQAQVQDENGSIGSGAPLEEVVGIILDRSVTFVGHDFYRYFSDYWRLTFTDNDDVLTVYERPSARWGSLIWVEYRSKELAKLFVSPSNKTKEIAEQVANQVRAELTRIKFAEQFQDTFDVDKDEI